MTQPPDTTSTPPVSLADGLRTIGARLCMREETQIDGRMILAYADAAGRLESETEEREEAVSELAMQLNDPLNTIARIVERFGKKPKAVDGSEPNDRR